MTPERFRQIKAVLNRRQADLTVVMENVRKPHNLAAVARTLEAVGGLEIHAITSLTSIRLSQMAAGGVRKWIKVYRHADTASALDDFRRRGYQIIATTLNETSQDYRSPDYTRPSVILAGEELEGLSATAIDMADVCVHIPMAGMVQSLNVSVATALVLYQAFHQRQRAGAFERPGLETERYHQLLFEACYPRVARLLRRRGEAYPPLDEEGMITTDRQNHKITI